METTSTTFNQPRVNNQLSNPRPCQLGGDPGESIALEPVYEEDGDGAVDALLFLLRPRM